jgi:hypothetical protein
MADLLPLAVIGATVAFAVIAAISRYRRLSWRRAFVNGVAAAIGLSLGLVVVPMAILEFGPLAAVVFFAFLGLVTCAVVVRAIAQSRS